MKNITLSIEEDVLKAGWKRIRKKAQYVFEFARQAPLGTGCTQVIHTVVG